MLKLLQGAERGQSKELFNQMHRQRKYVFKDVKGWDVPIVEDEFEIDEFDRPDTVYLMAFDRSDQLVGSARLVSTTTPHMLDGPFRSMFPNAAFRSPTIWEVTRFAVVGDRSIQPNGISTAACELLLGMCRFGLDCGLTQMVAVYDGPMERLYRRCGLRTQTIARLRTEHHGVVSVGVGDIGVELEKSILAATGLEGAYAETTIGKAA